jgi:hypothetical protein
MQTRVKGIATAKKTPIDGFGVVKAVTFIPNKDVTNVNGMKINARRVNDPTRSAC